MSVLVKGMEMPKSCFECSLSHPAYGMTIICGAIWKTIDAPDCEKQRIDNCPLVPVPPHGRLIDADALKAKQQEDADLFINAYTLMEKSRRDEALNAVANIVNAPTIIEAEDSEEVDDE